MRISTALMYKNAMNNVNQNLQAYLGDQEVLITQKRINRPSDDPIGSARALDIQKRLGNFEQYARNIGQAETFINQTEIALSTVSDALARLQELAMDINDGTNGPGEYSAAAAEVENLYDQILSAANTKIGNRYIFAGFRTTAQPFDAAGAYSGGVGDRIELEITDGSYLTTNFDGDQVFKNPVDVFQVVTDMQNAIAAGDQDQIASLMPEVDEALNQILSITAEVGARSNRLTAAGSANEELMEAYSAILSDIEDADMVSATIEFSKSEQVYQATLEVSSRILNQSFLDFLR